MAAPAKTNDAKAPAAATPNPYKDVEIDVKKIDITVNALRPRSARRAVLTVSSLDGVAQSLPTRLGAEAHGRLQCAGAARSGALERAGNVSEALRLL
jgi:hypothetical protein